MRPVDKIFPEAQRPQSIANNKCVEPPFGCGKPIKEEDWKNEISKREYKISGLCQKCQDEIWNED